METENRALTKRHEMQLTALNQNLANLRNELKTINLKITAKETEINEIKGLNLGTVLNLFHVI